MAFRLYKISGKKSTKDPDSFYNNTIENFGGDDGGDKTGFNSLSLVILFHNKIRLLGRGISSF